MTFTAWFSLFIVSLLGAMSPGPSLAVVVKNTLGGGRKSGIATAWAHAGGIGVYALLSMLGLVAILKEYPIFFRGISFAGALYLFWLGWRSLRSQGGIAATLVAGSTQSLAQSLRDGVIISVLNPKIGLFFLALFSQVIHAGVGTGAQVLTVLTPLCTDGCWYTLVAFVLSRRGILHWLREHAVVIDRLTGAVLMFLALRIVFVG